MCSSDLFKRVIWEAGMLGVMSSYNDYDGIPVQGSYYWLTTRLRGDGGFYMVYKTQGTCSREIHFDVENNKLKNVSFVGGCNGNLKGIGLLVEGMDIDEVIKRVEGVSCNGRPTSCPDQLARALKQYKEQQA